MVGSPYDGYNKLQVHRLICGTDRRHSGSLDRNSLTNTREGKSSAQILTTIKSYINIFV